MMHAETVGLRQLAEKIIRMSMHMLNSGGGGVDSQCSDGKVTAKVVGSKPDYRYHQADHSSADFSCRMSNNT